MKEKILVIAGPTASGKTALGVEMAQRLDGEIISADSMQIYKGMDIATAKPIKEEMRNIPHHLISFVDRNESFSVADYVIHAAAEAEKIISCGKMPIVVGGTGLYISSFVDNIRFPDIKSDEAIRKRLTDEAREYGNSVLLERLKSCDPEIAAELHENNLSRVIRALEVYEITGKKLSEFKKESRMTESPYDFIMTALTYKDRQKLYDRINMRVDIMIENGLIEESRKIYNESNNIKTAHQAIGYKELKPYFKNLTSLEECVEKIKQETRRYAKRQLTWLRKDDRISWIEADETADINFFIKKCEKIIAKH